MRFLESISSPRCNSSKAYCHAQLCKQATSLEEAADHEGKSAKFYFEAAEMYPEDEESHSGELLIIPKSNHANMRSPTVYLYQALLRFSKCGTPARDSLAIMERIRLALPKMEKIWQYSSQGLSGVNEQLRWIFDAENEMRKELQEGKYTLDDKIEIHMDS